MVVHFQTTSVLLLFLTFVYLLTNKYAFCESVFNIRCPDLCDCLDVYVDCSLKRLDELPVLPGWAEKLDLSSNNLQDNVTDSLLVLKNLTELKLKKNSLTSLPVLTGKHRLELLNVAYNSITHLPAEALEALPSLMWLDLTGNKIVHIKQETFPPGNNINFLSLNGNKIKVLTESCFNNLHKLTVLKLNRNGITDLPTSLFKNQKKLESLEINRNRLKTLDGLTFRPLISLTVLKLRRNRISELKDGAFWGLISIGTLEIDGNILTQISTKWLYGLKSLETLSLSNNKITSIDKDSWLACSHLKTLYLFNNDLKNIGKHTFEHLSWLNKLVLDGNKISSIDKNAFNHMPELQELDLNNNEISASIEDTPGIFSSLGKLTRLSLVSNSIRSISRNTFSGLKNLTRLDLSANEITTVKENAFVNMPNLQDFGMNSTDLICDCDLHWFSVWLQKARFVSVKASCGHPPSLRKRLVTDLGRNDFSCVTSVLPKIIEHPETKTAAKGRDVVLRCRVDTGSSGSANILWRHDNVDLPSNKTITSQNGTRMITKLLLKSVSHTNAGKYQCVVSNKFGSVHSHKAILSVLIYPSFSKVPRNVSAPIGGTARLECAADGQPRPQIAWQKDGGHDFPAAKERRLHVIVTDGVFLIENVTKDDTGIYSCAAHNPAGTIVANASLLVSEKPMFLQPMEPFKNVETGETVVLKCAAGGAPQPNITWGKDGTMLVSTERYYFSADNRVLVIFDANLDDSGDYECFFSNYLGNQKGQTKLSVVPVSKQLSSNLNIVCIIIVTAICCALFTSLVWFIVVRRVRTRATAAVVHRTSAPGLAYTDDTSERSSCKDSGMGDSAKRSSDDLLPPEELSLVVDDTENTPADGCEIETLDEITPGRPTNHERSELNSVPSPERV